jgi:GDP-4-dehydro-6-deoxy-D-mannose reductase
VIGTANVLAAARQIDGDPLTIVISSAEVYGIVAPGELPLTELSEVRPASPYAASKAAAEQVALQATRGFGQRVIVVRPFNHVGPGQPPVFAVPALAKRIVDAMAEGRTSLSVGTLTTRRDFTDVRDVVAAYRLLATRGTSGEVYDVCSGVDIEIAEIANRLLALAGTSLTLETDPSLIRPVDIPVLRGDATKLIEATGWAPVIPLDVTLADVLASFRT